MNKHQIHLLGFITIVLGLASCNSSEDIIMTNNVQNLEISNKHNSVFNTDNGLIKTDTLELYTNGGKLLSDIRDVCETENTVYILDNSNSITAFNKSNGEMIRQINNTGMGTNQYSEPLTISANENELYVYDMSGKMLTYDNELNYKQTAKISFPALDFIDIPDGFLFFNLLPNNKIKSIVHTDKNGNIKSSFLKTKTEYDMSAGNKLFIKDKNGDVFISLPLSDKVYLWNNDKLILSYNLKNNQGDKEELSKSSLVMKNGNSYNTGFFIPDNNCLLYSNINNGKRYYGLFNLNTTTSVSGAYNSASASYFYPRWQYKDNMIGCVNTYDLKTYSPKNKAVNCEAVLFSYKIRTIQ